MDSIKQMMLKPHAKREKHTPSSPPEPSPPTPAPQIPPRVKGKEGKAKLDLAGYYF